MQAVARAVGKWKSRGLCEMSKGSVGAGERWSLLSLDVGWEPELWLPIMPRGQGLSQIALISLSQYQPLEGARIARLKPGVTLAQAQAATDAQFQNYSREIPPEQKGDLRHIRLLPGDKGDHAFVDQFEQPLFILSATVWMLHDAARTI